MEIFMFCQVGAHAGPKCDVDEKTGKVHEASGWRLLPASVKHGKWVYNSKSGAKIYVCPTCRLPGEPTDN